ncbi:MAG: choice-of-anchor J domain-containing protein, partial [Ignavibacteriaceae bacterium]|nr:choice-of-anchor J domain-containing protein [Ignavibacteriaceae bacterium]
MIISIMLVFSGTELNAQWRTTNWEKSVKLSSLPSYFGTNLQRGMAYGFVNGNHRLYIVSTTSPASVIIINAETGDSVGTLSTTGISGGAVVLSGIGVSEDGVIFASNVTTNASTSPLKIYRWDSESADPVVAAELTTATALRFGDKLTVVGSVAGGTITLYAAPSTGGGGVDANVIYRFTEQAPAVLTPTQITLTGISTTLPGANAMVYPLTPGVSEFLYKASGSTARRFNSDGSIIDTLTTLTTTAYLNSSSISPKYFEISGRKYAVFYVFGTGTGSTANSLKLVDVTNNGSTQHFAIDATPSLGTSTNTNGTGDVAFRNNGNGTFDLWLLGTNNGIASYKVHLNTLPDTNPITSFPYTQSFTDGIVTGSGWSGTFWERGTEANTAPFAARVIYNYSGNREAFLVSPRIELPAAHRVKFFWKDDDINVVAGNDTTFFEISTDNGSTWNTLSFLSAPSAQNAYQEVTADLSAYAGNNVRLRWRDKTNGTFNAYGTGLDDILIEALPVQPVIQISPVTSALGNVFVGGSKSYNLTISNTGGAQLTGTLVPPGLVTLSTSTVDVAVGGSQIVAVTFTPTSAGSFSDSIAINTNDVNNPTVYAKLTATAVTPIVVTQINENFDTTTTTLPVNWSGNFLINATGGVNNSKRLTRNLYGTGGNLTGEVSLPFVSISPDGVLKFKYRVVNFTNYPTTPTPATDFIYYISISTNYGGTFTVVDSIGAHNHVVTLDYVEKTWNLNPLSGQTIQVKINGLKLNGDFYLDFDEFFVGTPPQVVIDWGNLQWPPDATITQGQTVDVYAQAYKAGVTDSAGQAFGLDAWIGISSTNTNPNTWTTWIPATFNNNVGNNDEFVAAIGTGLAPGTYYYASRFQYLNGPYRYGGLNNNFWDSTAHPSGVLTVNPYVVNTFPYTEGFDSLQFPPNYWARIDVNGGTTWNRTTANPYSGPGAARYVYSGTLPGDDWLITPALNLESGKVYSVTYYYRAETSAYPERLRVSYGSAQNVAAMTNVLAEHPNVDNTVYVSNTVFIAPTSTGLHYVGFQSYSLQDRWNLYLDNIVVDELPEVDYAVVGYPQIGGIPNPYQISVVTKTESEVEFVPSGAGSVSSDVIRTNFTFDDNQYTDGASLTPVNMKALVRRLGATGPAFAVNNGFDGVAGSIINRPGIGEVGGVDSVDISFTPSTKGTYTAWAYSTATGDVNTSNDTLRNFKVLVYPTPNIRFINDNGAQTAPTTIGFGANNLPLTAAVRFTTTSDVKLENIDAIYRNEASSDSIEVKIYSAGTDTTAPGAVIYSKKFAGENYINAGTGTFYVTLPLGEDAPIIMANNDYWVGMSFVSSIQFPMGAHAGTIPVPGRSFLSSDGGTWFPLVISSVPYAWYLRAVATAYTPPPPLTTVWQNAAASSNVPAWFSTTGSTERGMGAGKVMSAPPSRQMVDRVIIPSRNGGNSVRVVDGLTGADAGTLSVTGITGGVFQVNDAAVLEDGKILVGNVTTDATNPANPFKVYMYNDLGSDPVVAISYTSAVAERLGDKFFARGSYAAGTAEVWAAIANQAKVLKWTMSGGTFNQTPQVITLSAAVNVGSPAVLPLPNGDFYYNGNGISPIRFSSTGTAIDTIPGLSLIHI